jgi:hypothetical protein
MSIVMLMLSWLVITPMTAAIAQVVGAKRIPPRQTMVVINIPLADCMRFTRMVFPNGLPFQPMSGLCCSYKSLLKNKSFCVVISLVKVDDRELFNLYLLFDNGKLVEYRLVSIGYGKVQL